MCIIKEQKETLQCLKKSEVLRVLQSYDISVKHIVEQLDENNYNKTFY